MENDISGSEIGSGFGETGGTWYPHQEFPPGVTSPVGLGTLTPTSVDLDLLRRSFPLVDYELNSVALYKLFSVTPYELL